MTSWLERAQSLLEQSLFPVSQELNSLDWKSGLSPDRKRLAEHISAFANLSGGGFMVFGISPFGEKQGLTAEQPKHIITQIANIARDGLKPACQIEHAVVQLPSEGRVLLFVFIPESVEKPVHLRGKSLEHSFARSGGQTRKMDETEIRQALLSSRPQRFEELPVLASNITEVVDNMDLKPVCDRLGKPYSIDPEKLSEITIDLGFATRSREQIIPTFLGVIVAAKDFGRVPGCERYGVKVTQYAGTSKLSAQKEKIYTQGFVHSFDQIIEEIIGMVPHSEVIEKATRKRVPLYPVMALRELIANAVIHRDYSRTDSYVQIEIFEDRIEITNPGSLLPGMDVDRLIDQQPRARNEVLASRMRELGFCEERGSGIDKVAFELELYGLPAVAFENFADSFKAALFRPKDYKKMPHAERLRTAYQHTCLHYVMKKDVTNASLRERLKLSEGQSQLVSKLIRQCIESRLIKVANPGASPRYVRYIPIWA
ncbi:MAG: putative DNA binding domain-containing protein [Elusimicrobia bacterium]|nr:putative DNA binding domain-containing protein [Candidatus Obscuribacterium magneticum]